MNIFEKHNNVLYGRKKMIQVAWHVEVSNNSGIDLSQNQQTIKLRATEISIKGKVVKTDNEQNSITCKVIFKLFHTKYYKL